MTNQASRKALHAYVTDSAHEQWHGFAAEQGVSVSAILEALAPALSTGTDEIASRSVVLETIIIQARRIDAARRRRTR